FVGRFAGFEGVSHVPDLNIASVSPFVNQLRGIGRPPVTSRSIHLLLGHKLGQTMRNQMTPTSRDAAFLVRFEIVNKEIVIDHIRDMMGVWRDRKSTRLNSSH